MNRVRSNLEWIAWGRRDPLFAACAWAGTQRGGPNSWSVSDFYAVGARDWNDFSVRWEKYGVDRTSCVEVGCGPGRITNGLAQYFGRVYALDVSSEMLHLARKQLAGLPVLFVQTDGATLPLVANSVSAAFSCHVFQHLDSPIEIAAQFRELFRVLKPGGSAMIHLRVHSWPVAKKLLRALYHLRNRARNVRAGLRRTAIASGGWAAVMQSTSCEVEWLDNELSSMGFQQIVFTLFNMGQSGDLQSFVFARKPISKG